MDIKELKKQLTDEHFKSVVFAGFECHEHGNLEWGYLPNVKQMPS